MSEHAFAYITTDPDNMTLADALCQPDYDKFLVDMHKEFSDHTNYNHWKVIPTKNVSSHKKRLPMDWSMKTKRNYIGEIIKWKACLCAGGHRLIEFVDYWDTYPLVS